MDLFQLIADFLHLIAINMLLVKILANRNVLGLSYKTQQLFLVVFLTRYIDLLIGWRSFYLFTMKILFISLTAYTIYLMRFKKPFKISFDPSADNFPHHYIYFLALVMSIIIHKSLNPLDFIWSFSIWLQAGAIVPQLAMMTKIKEVQNITAHYIFLLGIYRILYIFHWIFHWEAIIFTSFIAGIIQSLLYADFIYYFFKSGQNQRIIQLPV